MLIFCYFQYFLFPLLHCVRAAWPSSNLSNYRLLGLFPDADNASKTTDMSVHSRAMFKAAIVLSQQYNVTIEGAYINWEIAQTGGNVINALGDTCKAVSSSTIVGIIGPAFSGETVIVAELAGRIGIPIISYSATDPDLSDRKTYPTFYRTVPSDNITALAIVKLFLRYNWTSCIIIYQNDAFGTSGAKVINDALVDNGLLVREMIVFNTATRTFRNDLNTDLMNIATRIVVLWADTTYTSSILQQALDADVLGPLFTWILSSSIPLDTFDQSFLPNLIGLLTVEPVTAAAVGVSVNTTLLNAAYNVWKQYELETFPTSTPVDNYALFTFDATWSLIQALQKLCSNITTNSSSCLSFTNDSYCFDRRLIPSDSLLDMISETNFLGVSGSVEFHQNSTERVNGAYYYAQNSQPSANGTVFVPVLVYSDPNEWKVYTGTNVIIWPGTTLTPSTGIASLQGISLRVCITEVAPFTIITNVIGSSGQSTPQYSGYVPDLIELLVEQIGFNVTLLVSPSNQTYDSLIQAVANGTYDIWIGDVTVTSARREKVGFSNSIFDNSLRIIMRKTPDVNYELLSFLKPFSRNLWLLVLGACLYAGILFCIMERADNSDFRDRSIISQISLSLWYSFGNIVGYGVDFHASTAAGRLLTMGLYILSLILVASYTANLASDLTIAKSIDIIDSIDDIRNGKIPYSRIGIRVGTASEEYYLREISGGIKNYYPLYSKQDTYDSLVRGVIDVSFIDSGVGEYITKNVYCNLTLVGEGFDNGVFGIVTPKDWSYTQDLDVHVLSLRETGDLDNLEQKWFEKKTCPDSAVESTALGVEALGGLFVIFAIVSTLAVVLYLWIKRKNLRKCLPPPIHRIKRSSRYHTNRSSKRAQQNEVPFSISLHA